MQVGIEVLEASISLICRMHLPWDYGAGKHQNHVLPFGGIAEPVMVTGLDRSTRKEIRILMQTKND